MRNTTRLLTAPLLAAALIPGSAIASSHMDAPLITFDDPANTTDVYAFLSEDQRDGDDYLTTAVSVYPFEEPGIEDNCTDDPYGESRPENILKHLKANNPFAVAS